MTNPFDSKSLFLFLKAFASGRPAITSVVEDCTQPYEEAYLDPNAPEGSAVVCEPYLYDQ